MKRIYFIPQKIKTLTDKRNRKSIPLFNLVMPVFLSLLLQYESFYAVFSSPESMNRRLKHCIRGRIAKVDAVRDMLEQLEIPQLQEIHDEVIDKIYKNKGLRGGTINGYIVAVIDGVELFGSTEKRQKRN